MTHDWLEELERLNAERTRDIGDWEYAPATPGYITTIFGRYKSGEPCGIAYACCGVADQQNADAAFITAAANHMTTLLRGYREMREALEPFAKEAALWPDYVPGSDGLFIASPDDIEPILDEYAAEQGRATAGISFSSDTVTVGDLRRARAALQSTGGKEQKEETL